MSTQWATRSNEADLTSAAVAAVQAAAATGAATAIAEALTPGAGVLWLSATPEVYTLISANVGSTTYNLVSAIPSHHIGVVGLIVSADAATTWSLQSTSTVPLIGTISLAANQTIAVPVAERRQYVNGLEEGINLVVSNAAANITVTVSYILLNGF